METMDNENLITNTSESNDEKINNISKNEITISYFYGPCDIASNIILTIICPIFFYKFLFQKSYKQVIRVDKKKKILIIGRKGIADCCSCCVSYFDQYDLNGIKNVKFKIQEINVSKKKFSVNIDKAYYITCYVYSIRGESSQFFYNTFTKEKYDELVLFFKQFTEVSEEIVKTLNDLKTGNDIPSKNEITTNDEQNNIESKPSFNDAAPILALRAKH